VSETLADLPAPDIENPPTATASPVDAAVIFDSVVEAIMVFDPDSFQIAEANRGAVELLGRSRDELIGQSVVEVLRGADAQRFESHVAALAAGGADSTTLMLDYLTGDGSSIAVEVVLQPIDLPGGSRVVVAIARDIRGRIETQIRLQRLAEHSRAPPSQRGHPGDGARCGLCRRRITVNPAGQPIFPGRRADFDDILAQPVTYVPRGWARSEARELRTAPTASAVEIDPSGSGRSTAADHPAPPSWSRDVTESSARGRPGDAHRSPVA
jgi:PAS domain S-box-containing protein